MKNLPFIISFLTYAGYYVVLGAIIALGYIELSRSFTVPLRLLTLGLICISIVKYGFKLTPQNRNVFYFFFAFWLVYFCRIAFEMLRGNPYLHKSPSEMALFAFSFGIMPFLYFNQQRSDEDYKLILKGILVAIISLSFLSLYLYLDLLIAGVGRINKASNVMKEDVSTLSPLALSYSSAAGIAIVLSIFLYKLNGFYKLNKYLLILAASVPIAPFLLGASRGSVIAFILPFIVINFLKSGKGKLKSIVLMTLFIVVVGFLATLTGSGVFVRLITTYNKYESGNSADGRESYYSSSFDQFLGSPLVGDSLQNELFKFYPHNIILEVMLSTGLIGLIPFLMLLYMAWRRSMRIINHRQELIWIVILYWQGFLQHMFSGALYSALWFWASLGLILSVRTKRPKPLNLLEIKTIT